MQVAGADICMKVDTGAETNSIPVKTWLKIVDRPNLTPSRVTLRAFGGATVPHEGSAQVKFSVNGHDATSEIFVTPDKTVPILGLRTSGALGLVRPGCNAAQPPVLNQLTQLIVHNRSMLIPLRNTHIMMHSRD